MPLLLRILRLRTATPALAAPVSALGRAALMLWCASPPMGA
jgi:hypothetical protein